MKDRNKGHLTIIGLGGAGIKSGINAYETIVDNKEACSDIDIRLVDTTDKTVIAFPEYVDKFYKITSNRSSGEIDGSGGEKRNLEVVKDITENMKDYLDNGKFKNNKNNYYVILASVSGGSGSTASAILLSLMLSKGYNVIVVAIGDTSSYHNLKNTFGGLASLQNIAIKTKTAVSVVYYNNTVDGNTSLVNEIDVNSKISKMLTVISVFISGKVLNIDNQDYINFFKPTNYKTFTVDAGIYELVVFKGNLDDQNALISRTLLKDAKDEYKVGVDLRNKKDGIATKEICDLIETFPLHLVIRKNVLTVTANELNKRLKELDSLNQSDYVEFEGIDDTVTVDDDDDDLGLIL